MKRKGHLGVGLIALLPIVYGKTLPYINTNDAYIIKLNNIIYNFNEHLILLNTLLFDPLYNLAQLLLIIFFYYLGIRYPDFDLLIKKIFPSIKDQRYLYHRQLTHSLIVTLFILFYFNKNIYIFFFAYGIITHLIADMITGSIPIFFFGKYYKTLNVFQWRIGIDLIYMLFKPKYKRGNTKLQIIIQTTKDLIVNMFEKLYYFIILFFIASYIYMLF